MENKDGRIIKIVRYLQDKFGDNIKLKDYWEADNCAIGLTNLDDTNLAYLSTYNQIANKYFIALEKQSEDKTQEFEECGSFSNISIGEVEKLVKEHLNL